MRRGTTEQIRCRHLHRRIDREKGVGDELERRQRVDSRLATGPPTIVHASFTCGSPSDFDAPPSVNDSTSARRAISVAGACASSGILRKDFVGDDRPPSLAADRGRARRLHATSTYEPVGLFGDTSSTARTSSGRGGDRLRNRSPIGRDTRAGTARRAPPSRRVRCSNSGIARLRDQDRLAGIAEQLEQPAVGLARARRQHDVLGIDGHAAARVVGGHGLARRTKPERLRVVTERAVGRRRAEQIGRIRQTRRASGSTPSDRRATCRRP